MDESAANAIAEALGDETWQSGGDIWLVVFRRPDGRVVVVSDDVVCEYADNAAFDAGHASATIAFR